MKKNYKKLCEKLILDKQELELKIEKLTEDNISIIKTLNSYIDNELNK